MSRQTLGGRRTDESASATWRVSARRAHARVWALRRARSHSERNRARQRAGLAEETPERNDAAPTSAWKRTQRGQLSALRVKRGGFKQRREAW